MRIAPVVAGVVGLGAAVGVGIAVEKWSEPLGKKGAERRMDRNHADFAKEQAALKPGQTTFSTFAPDPDPGDYRDAAPGVFGFFASAGTAIGGVALLAKGGSNPLALLGGAAVLAAAAIPMAWAVGHIKGDHAGVAASEERHGIDIAAQAKEAVETFGRGDGVIDIDASGNKQPEFLRQLPRESWEPENVLKIESIEQVVSRADANGDKRVTAAEVQKLLQTYDSNGNGLLSAAESKAYFGDKLEIAALRQVG